MQVQACRDQFVIATPKVVYNFIPLSQIAQHVDQCVDVLAIIDQVDETATVTRNSQARFHARHRIRERAVAGDCTRDWTDAGEAHGASGRSAVDGAIHPLGTRGDRRIRCE